MRTTTTIGTAVCAGLLAMLAGCAARADGAGVGNAAPSGNAGSSTSISTTVAMWVTTALSMSPTAPSSG